MMRHWAPCLLCVVVIACTSRSSQPRDQTAGDAAASGEGDAALIDNPIDEHGYSIVGDDVFPPLYQRVEARCARSASGVPSACAADDDCGSGFACICGHFLDNQCVPAECRTSADCDGGKCLLSLNSAATECCGYGRPSLVCSRSASTCQHGGDCPGNGIACIFDPSLDYFECKRLECSCGT